MFDFFPALQGLIHDPAQAVMASEGAAPQPGAQPMPPQQPQQGAAPPPQQPQQGAAPPPQQPPQGGNVPIPGNMGGIGGMLNEAIMGSPNVQPGGPNTPPDLSAIYARMVQQQEAGRRFDSGIALIAAGLTRDPSTRNSLINVASHSMGSGEDAGSLAKNLQAFQEQARTANARAALWNNRAQLATQYGIPQQTVESLINSDQWNDYVLAKAKEKEKGKTWQNVGGMPGLLVDSEGNTKRVGTPSPTVHFGPNGQIAIIPPKGVPAGVAAGVPQDGAPASQPASDETSVDAGASAPAADAGSAVAPTPVAATTPAPLAATTPAPLAEGRSEGATAGGWTTDPATGIRSYKPPQEAKPVKLNSAEQKVYDAYLNAGYGAHELKNTLGELKSAYDESKDKIPWGPAAKLLAQGAPWSVVKKVFGLDDTTVQNMQVIYKNSELLAGQRAKAISPRATNADLRTAQGSVPNLGLDKGAFGKILEQYQGLADRSIEAAEQASKHSKTPDFIANMNRYHEQRSQRLLPENAVRTKVINGVTYHQMPDGRVFKAGGQ